MIRAVLLLIFFFTFISANAQQERKFHLWNFNSILVSISNKTSIYASEKVHYEPTEPGLDLKFGDIWFKHKTTEWFEYAGGFRVLYSKNQLDWIEEQRPMIMGTFSEEIKQFDVSFSHRMEYRLYKKINDHFRYRQKINIQSPSLTSFGLQLFTAEETYTKLNYDRTHLIRLYAGIQTVNSDHFAMKLYYALEKHKKYSVWNTGDVLGMNLSFKL